MPVAPIVSVPSLAPVAPKVNWEVLVKLPMKVTSSTSTPPSNTFTVAWPLPSVTVSVGVVVVVVKFSSVTVSPVRNPANLAASPRALTSVTWPPVTPFESVTNVTVWPLLTPTPLPNTSAALP